MTIHVGRYGVSESTPGHLWLDRGLLASGGFAWATVMDEYAHQVDFFVLDPTRRALLQQRLGASAWCYEVSGLAHGAHGCERFASMVAWAYWPSLDNPYRPASPADESAAMPAGRVPGSALGDRRHAGTPVGADQALDTQAISDCLSAVATAWVRVSASSLAIALRTCVRTVSGEMNSSLPISWFDIPSESSRSTSRSRWVRFVIFSVAVELLSTPASTGSNVGPAGRDELNRTHHLGERRLQKHKPARTGVERLC